MKSPAKPKPVAPMDAARREELDKWTGYWFVIRTIAREIAQRKSKP